MNVLVVGNGGREHALTWKIAQSKRVKTVFVAPGNAGTDQDGVNVDISPNDIERLVRFAKENAVELTVVGPEAPLVDGIVDAFVSEKLRVFGPSKAASKLEGSKVFCKDLLHGADVPTADYGVGFAFVSMTAPFATRRVKMRRFTMHGPPGPEEEEGTAHAAGPEREAPHAGRNP